MTTSAFHAESVQRHQGVENQLAEMESRVSIILGKMILIEATQALIDHIHNHLSKEHLECNISGYGARFAHIRLSAFCELVLNLT